MFFKLVLAKLLQFYETSKSLLVEGVVLILLAFRKLLKIASDLFVHELFIVFLILYELSLLSDHVLVGELEVLLLVGLFFDLFESKVVSGWSEAKWGCIDKRIPLVFEFLLLLLNQVLASQFPIFMLDINLLDPLIVDLVDVGLDFDLQLELVLFLDGDQQIPGNHGLSLFHFFEFVLILLSRVVLVIKLLLNSKVLGLQTTSKVRIFPRKSLS